MFEAVELGQSLSHQAFDAAEPGLRARLLGLQREARRQHLALIVVIAGLPGAGKGAVVNRLLEWLDARNVQVHADWDETEEETQRPRWWRFWRKLPGAGCIGLFFEGWYRQPLHRQALDPPPEAELDAECARIADTERMWVQGGALVVKLWCHLPRRVYHKRVRQQRRDPRSHWRMAPETAIYARHYEAFVEGAQRVIRLTDTGFAPWQLVDASDHRHRDIEIGRLLADALAQRLAAPAPAAVEQPAPGSARPADAEARASVLDGVDLSQALSKRDYRESREALQARVNALTWEAFRRRCPSLLVFEGWDAAGKGGTIRRLVNAIDARLVNVVPVSAPSDEEAAHHYLWRFWRRLPRDGYCTVFDRSWYGRVLVERVEGLTPPATWARAYHEINDFEAQFVEHGGILLKFWLHIDTEEQLRRFRSREATPYKRHKITDEDWRNRQRWPAYQAAVDEMVLRTSTEYAPWQLIAANDKRHARICVLAQYAAALERALEAG